MAKVTEVKQNFASRLGDSLQEAGQQLGQGLLLKEKLATAKAQREALGTNQKLMEQQLENQKMELSRNAIATKFSIAGQLARIQDPKKRKALFKQYAPTWSKANATLGFAEETDPELITMMAEEVDNFRQTLENTTIALENNDKLSPLDIQKKLMLSLGNLPPSEQKAMQPLVEDTLALARQKQAEREASKAGLEKGAVTVDSSGKAQSTFAKPKPQIQGLTPEQSRKAKSDFLARLDKNPELKASNKTISQANNILAFIGDKGNSIGDNAFVTLMARASGEVGNLAEKEQTRFSGSRALADRISQWIETNRTGKLTDKNRKEALDLLGRFMKGANKSYTSKVAELATQSSRASGVAPEVLINVAGLDIRSNITKETMAEVEKEIKALDQETEKAPESGEDLFNNIFNAH